MRTIEARNRAEWRTWLESNHSKVGEIWLVYYKKHTKKPTITYLDSVEEALCFGWIDGIKKRIDDERYTHRFTPRKKNSKWSPTNINIAKRMINSNRMTKVGLQAYNKRIEYASEFLKIHSSFENKFPTDIEQKLRMNKIAWNNFNNLAPSHRKQYILWMNSAKKEETKQKRLSEAIKLLEQNKTLGMK